MRSPVVTALSCIAATGIAGCGAPRAEPAPRPQPPIVPLLVDPVPQRPDAEDRDRRLRGRSRAAVADRPALQHVPLLERHLAIDIAGVSSDGRVVLLVRSDLGRVAARRGYRAFLRRLDDDGTAYLPTFQGAG